MKQLRAEGILDLVGRGYVVGRAVPSPVSRRRLGLVLPRLDNPFFAGLADAVSHYAAKRNFELMVAAGEYSSDREAEALRRLEASGVGGILACPGIDPQTATLYGALSVPVVFLARQLPGLARYAVLAENFQGGRLAARHFLETGCSVLAYAGLEREEDERLDGFRFELTRAGVDLPAARTLRLADWTSEAAEAEFLKILPQWPRPVGLFAFHDLIAVGALRAAQKLGFRIPEELAVIGFDDLPLAAEVRPALTTLGYPVFEMARIGLDLLQGLIAGEEGPPEPKPVCLTPRLVVRESGGGTLAEARRRESLSLETGYFDYGLLLEAGR